MMATTRPAIGEKLLALIVSNSFRGLQETELPAVELIEDAIFASSSTLLSEALLTILQSISTSTMASSKVERDILRTKCLNAVSFPDNLANAARSSSSAVEPARFDREAYAVKLSDSFWRVALDQSDTTHGTAEQARVFTRIFAQTSVRRGLGPVLASRLAAALVERKDSAPELLVAQLQLVSEGVLGGSVNRQSRRRVGAPSALRLTSAWSIWLDALLTVAETGGSGASGVMAFLLRALAAPPSSPAEVDARVDGEGGEGEGASAEEVTQEIQRYLFADALASRPTPRSHLRLLYTTLFPQLQHAGETAPSQGTLPRCVEEALTRVFLAWETKELVSSGPPVMNTALFHSVMYALSFLKEQKVETLPPRLLSPFLNGVSVRMESVHAERQSDGVTAAAAFATFFVGGSEAAAGFLAHKDFSSRLEAWLVAEAGATRARTLRTTHHQPHPHPQQDPAMTATPLTACTFHRTETLPTREDRPLHPDTPYLFFTFGRTSEWDGGGLSVMHNNNNSNSNSGSSSSGRVALGCVADGAPAPSGTLPAFGVQRLARDETDAAILSTFREAYEALMGIGRGASAQMHDVQQAIESGLYAMARALTAMEHEVLGSNGSAMKLPAHLDPLLPGLLPTLMSLSIYAPEDKSRVLYGVRYQIVVKLIALSPKVALHTLSGMLYGSNYGMYQRVELARAAGDAARALAAMELPSPSSMDTISTSLTETNASERKPKRRVYPPIPVASEKRAIILDEGKATRRWGHAVHARMQARSRARRYLNALGDVAPLFIASLLARLDADHFKFFQDHDPYVPAEVLRTLTIVFQGVANIRHVAPALCERNIDFFFTAAMHHPHMTIRKQAWVVTGEVMRCWCGAPPAMEVGKESFSRAPGFAYAGSLMFTEQWINTLELLQSLCVDLDRKKDPVFVVAALTIATLRDLVAEQRDVEAMESLTSSSRIIAV